MNPHPVLTGTILFAYLVLRVLLSALAQDRQTHEQCVSLRITNCHARTVRLAYGPVDLCAEVRIQPKPEHRWIEVVWDYAPPSMIPQAIDGLMLPGVQESDPFIDLEQLSDVEQQNGSLGSSLRSLNGAHQPIRNDIKMTHLEGGTYLVTAKVFTDTERKRMCGFATSRVQVR